MIFSGNALKCCDVGATGRSPVVDRRKNSIRLEEYDYSNSGGYFITLCTHEKQSLFGEIKSGIMRLNDFGVIVYEEWNRSSEIRKEIELDRFIVMPNHIHGIIFIRDDEKMRATGRSPLRINSSGPLPKSLGSFIAGFKTAAAKRINETRRIPGAPVWQRNYYEHIIRNEDDLNDIRQYIICNPSMWAKDENYV